MMRHCIFVFTVTFVFVLGITQVFAQTGSSVITGAVTDPTGLAIPGVSITFINQQTGARVDTLTNDVGSYRSPSLSAGSYVVEAELPGFSKLTRGSLTLQVSQTIAVDLQLQLGQVSETVSVTESVPLTDSQSSMVSQVVDQQMVTALPLPNRAASSLATLSPGVVMIDTGAGTAENYPLFSIAGGRARNQNFILDGGSVNNAVGLTRPSQMVTLPVDAMQEFRVVANNYPAEYGHSTGGVVTMSTRSGTNQYHGSLFESLQNDALNARNFFATKRTPVRLNQYGGTFGGPIRKDKTHFFATWEETRQLISFDLTSTVPTLQERRGDFSDLRDANGNLIRIYDPATGSTAETRNTFPGNIIPAGRIDPVARAAINYFPLPNRAGTPTNANNYAGSSANKLHRDIVLGRLDHQLNASNLITARYYINGASTVSPGTYGIPAADPLADSTEVRVQSIMGTYSHIFSSSLTNQFRYSYLRRKFIDSRAALGSNLAEQIGLTGVSNTAFPSFTIPGFGVPAGTVSGNITIPGTGAALGNPVSISRVQTPIVDGQLLNGISWYRGKHALSFGGEYRMGANDERRDRGSSGNFTMSPLITSLPGSSGTSGNALASFILGEVNAASRQVSDQIRSRASYLGFYLQDDWRASDRLTVNAGIRWETEFPRYVIGNNMNSFDPLAVNPVSETPGVVTFAGVNGTPVRAFKTDINNFGPRLGFAYRVPGNRETVIRGGAGIFYSTTVSNSVGDLAASGFSTSATFSAAQAETQSVFLLRDGFPAITRQALTPGFGAVPLGEKPNTSIGFFKPDQVSPLSYQYNVGVQREVAAGVLVEAGYMGNVSHHLTANDFTLNQVAPELMGTNANPQLLRPFPQFNNVSWINPSIGNSTYHAGFVRAEKRMSGGLSYLVHYTFSKFIDDVEGASEFGSTGSYMDAYHRNLDKGLSGSDVPHRFLGEFLYEIPEIKNAFINRVLGGWRLGIMETAESGPTFTVIAAADTTAAFPAGPVRPNLLHAAAFPNNQRAIARWFDVSAFASPAPFTFGNSPRSVLRGAALVMTDATVEKALVNTESLKFELRGEFYNLLNHTNFNIPGFTLSAPDFGSVSSARPPRTLQLAARLRF